MRRRAFTLLEVMVGSGVLLVMVAVASLSVISYLRGYGHYTKEGAKLRLASKTLETVCFELRSARSFKSIPPSIRQKPLEFEDTRRRPCSLNFRGNELWVQHDSETHRLGSLPDIQLTAHDGLLEIAVPIEGQAPLRTAISLSGVRR